MKQRRRKTMKGLILAFAVAAIIPPVAQARIDSERSQIARPVSSYYSSPAYRALMVRSEALNQKYGLGQNSSQKADPWFLNLMANQKYGLSGSTTVRHADDRAGIRGPGITQAPQLASTSSNGFDWGDASLGAGTALAAAIIVSSGVALNRRNRTGAVPA